RASGPAREAPAARQGYAVAQRGDKRRLVAWRGAAWRRQRGRDVRRTLAGDPRQGRRGPPGPLGPPPLALPSLGRLDRPSSRAPDTSRRGLGDEPAALTLDKSHVRICSM